MDGVLEAYSWPVHRARSQTADRDVRVGGGIAARNIRCPASGQIDSSDIGDGDPVCTHVPELESQALRLLSRRSSLRPVGRGADCRRSQLPVLFHQRRFRNVHDRSARPHVESVWCGLVVHCHALRHTDAQWIQRVGARDMAIGESSGGGLYPSGPAVDRPEPADRGLRAGYRRQNHDALHVSRVCRSVLALVPWKRTRARGSRRSHCSHRLR